jgi:ABC-type glutathione transport system ATPase component
VMAARAVAQVALTAVNFRAEPGELVAIVGQVGAGK